MNVGKTVAIASLVLGLSACTTIQSARDKLVKTPSRCVDQTVQIYFEPDSAEVTKEGRAVLNLAANDSKACKVSSIDVVGLADAAGAPGANLELSKRRAQAVTEALTAAGLPAAEFKVAAAGSAEAINSKGDARPLRRRTDVVLHLSPR